MPTAPQTNPLVFYQLHVLLLDVNPAIWRRILVLSNSTIADLHFVLQFSMGWRDRRPHRFVLHAQQYGCGKSHDVHTVIDTLQLPLSAWRLRLNERLLYTYGFLDKWRLQLRLEKVAPYDSNLNYPICLTGARQGPPEHCDGPADFMTKRDQHPRGRVDQRLLAIIAICQVKKPRSSTIGLRCNA